MRSWRRALIQNDWCPYKKRRLGPRHTEGRPCEDTGRRRLTTCQRERPQEDSPCRHLHLRSAASRRVRCSAAPAPVYGILSEQPTDMQAMGEKVASTTGLSDPSAGGLSPGCTTSLEWPKGIGALEISPPQTRSSLCSYMKMQLLGQWV